MSNTISEDVSSPEALTKEDLLWALSTIMDGVQEHDIVSMTGVSQEDASRLYQISSRAIKASIKSGIY